VRMILSDVSEYLYEQKRLQIKENIQIQQIRQGISYCGFRVLPGTIRMSRRKKTALPIQEAILGKILSKKDYKFSPIAEWLRGSTWYNIGCRKPSLVQGEFVSSSISCRCVSLSYVVSARFGYNYSE